MAAKASTYPAKRRAMEEDIKTRVFRKAYLIFGEEAYLRDQTRSKLASALSEGLNEMNVNRFSGTAVEEGVIIDTAETLPFFNDYRLIIVEDAGLFKGSDHPVADYIKEAPDTVRFLFIEHSVDKRSKLYKAVDATGLTIECDTPSEKDILTWIGVKCKQEGKKITQGAATRLLEIVGTDMLTLSQEIDKLIAYTAGREGITEEDVATSCASYVSGRIFQMTDAIADRNRERALDLYYDLLALKEPSQRILFLITRQFNLMLQVKELVALRTPFGRIAQETGLQEFIVRKYAAWAERYETAQLRTLLNACADNDEAVKTGRLHERVGVEMLIVQATQ